MVSALLPLVIFLGLPLALLIIYKSNAGVMFLAACAGLVLLSSLDDAVVTTAGSVVPGEGEAYVRLSVVLLSIFFAALMFRHTVHGTKLFLHGAIVILLAGMLWVTVPGVTGLSWLQESSDLNFWLDLYSFRSIIIALGFSLSLIAVLTSRHKSKHKSKKH